MYTTTTFLTLTLSTLAALTTAAPSKTTNLKVRQSSTPYEGISISVCVSPGLTPPAQKVYEPAPVELNVLGYCYGDNGTGCSVSSLTIDPGVIPNGVDLANVECRAYKDFAGIEPGSAPFTVNSPALISTNLATISSFLCYVVEASE